MAYEHTNKTTASKRYYDAKYSSVLNVITIFKCLEIQILQLELLSIGGSHTTPLKRGI